MLPEFMNLLCKFYFMRAAARSTRVEMLLFDRLKGVFPLLSVRLRQPEQSRLAQTVEQLVEPCNDVVRTGCVCYRCRRFRTCTGRAGRAGWANCACFSGRACRAGRADCARFTRGAGRAGRANCACFTCRASRAGSADCACFTCRSGRAGSRLLHLRGRSGQLGDCACFTCQAGWPVGAGGANCTRFTCGACRAGRANCACFSRGACRAGWAGWADCACFTCGAGRAG